jgi:hypothetical protein
MSAVSDVVALFERWQIDVGRVREQVYRAPSPRERWHALWLLARGLSQAQVAEALERDPHTVGEWLEGFRQLGPGGLAFEQTGGSPPPSTKGSRQS